MMLFAYITTGFLLLYGLLFCCYYRGWRDLPSFEAGRKEVTGFTPTLIFSIIIPARNESARIGPCILSLVDQDYPAHLLEIIVVNDHSTDDTEDIVKMFGLGRVKVINLQYEPGEVIKAPKKRAIEKGIAAALGDWIVTTDADCVAGPHWISRLAAYQQAYDPLFIAAPVKILDFGTLLSKFQALDFLTMQGITGAAVYTRIHNMCNGANLAYPREVFYEVNGFDGIDTIASGDDMLLMHKIAQKHPGRTSFIKSSEAIMVTHPAITWGEFFQQRIRWASKATHYKSSRLFGALAVVYFTNAGILLTGILAFFYPPAFWSFCIFWMCKFLLEVFFVKKVAGFFHQRHLIPYLFLLQPMHMLYIVVSGFFGQFKTYRWKGRQLK